MRITDIKTYLMQAGAPATTAWSGSGKSALATGRNWLFVRVETDEGLTGIGEGSGWPRVVQTAVQDLKTLLIGENPFDIERLWQKMYVGMMGHGDTGVVGAGAITAIDMALWDLKGKALGTPVWNLLGGKVRDRIRCYAHAKDAPSALALVEKGMTAVKVGGVANILKRAEDVRAALPSTVDMMVDLHGPPWMTAADAITLGRSLEPLGLLFLEEPVAPENIDGLRRLRRHLTVPIAAGERWATGWGLRCLLDEGLVDVLQPDSGRAGGITQLKKIAAMAEAHMVQFAPHSGSLGPIAEYAAAHVMASIPNALMMERLEPDWEGRFEAVTPPLRCVDGFITVPDRPGLGVEINEDFIAEHPSTRNIAIATGGWEPGTEDETAYVQPRFRRRAALITSRPGETIR
ncbi:MAG: mandelate racemase/muconate lactonizing enzyme family protein [Elstera sp.]